MAGAGWGGCPARGGCRSFVHMGDGREKVPPSSFGLAPRGLASMAFGSFRAPAVVTMGSCP